MTEQERVVVALPSKGALAEPTLSFLAECGLRPVKTSPRHYTARIPALPEVSVLFQRARDIVQKVADGTVDLGITGLDIVSECEEDGKKLILLHDDLGYGHCDLVLAVPDTWIDVDSLADIADIALEFRETKGRDLRVATGFPNLTRQFLLENGVPCFAIVAASGAVEAAPAMGYAEIIADLTSTGTTLRANHLKLLGGGLILRSQACLIGNARSMQQREPVVNVARLVLEMIDAKLQGRHFSLVTASVRGVSAAGSACRAGSTRRAGIARQAGIARRAGISRQARIAQRLLEEDVVETRDQLTITRLDDSDSPVEIRTSEMFSVSLTVRKSCLLRAVTCLRGMGATNILVTQVRYRFTDRSESYSRLRARLRKDSR